MLTIVKSEKPHDTVSQNWYVRCERPALPASVQDIVEDIVAYAKYPVGAYRTNTDGVEEYLIEFETTDGFTPIAQFCTLEKLRERVRLMLISQCHNRNVVIGIGRTPQVCLRLSGTITGDRKRVYLNGEILTPEGLPFRKMRAKSCMPIRSHMLQEFAFA